MKIYWGYFENEKCDKVLAHRKTTYNKHQTLY